MFVLIGFAFIAGIVTVLSPCILPVLPIVLAGSVNGGKARPLGVITGFVVSFTVFTLTLSIAVRALHIPPDILRILAAILIIVFGFLLVVPILKYRFMALFSKVASRPRKVKSRPSPDAKRGYWSGVVLGSSLGLVWTPCAGPIMASVITLALSRSVDVGSVVITLSYSLGTALPLFIIMQGGMSLLRRFPFFLSHSSQIQRVFGSLMIVTALALFTGADRSFQTWFLQTFPRYGEGLSSVDDRNVVKKALAARSAANVDNSADPLTLGSGVWLNSKPLALSELKGKVVIIDIWTYSCINCLRTLPYLKEWNTRYRDKGLVIVGVHSPEFVFEKSEQNLRKAITELGVTWPVVQDNDFKIWQYYNNQYWPAHFLYAKDGNLAESHFGEGGYAETEKKIQELLGVSAPVSDQSISSVRNTGISPETYLGYSRGERFTSPEPVVNDMAASYSVPANIRMDHWAFSGKWTINSESSASQTGSALSFCFNAGKVYLVINPVPGEPASVNVFLDGKPFTSGEVKNGILSLNGNRLYQLYDSTIVQKGILRIEFKGKVKVFAFTFG